MHWVGKKHVSTLLKYGFEVDQRVALSIEEEKDSEHKLNVTDLSTSEETGDMFRNVNNCANRNKIGDVRVIEEIQVVETLKAEKPNGCCIIL